MPKTVKSELQRDAEFAVLQLREDAMAFNRLLGVQAGVTRDMLRGAFIIEELLHCLYPRTKK